MKIELDRGELMAACNEVARSTMWDLRPVDVTSIQAVADEFYEIALTHLDLLVQEGRDPNLITRAVKYLARSHAIPPMREDTRWFSDMLTALIELACPTCSSDPDSHAFLRDIEEGILGRGAMP